MNTLLESRAMSRQHFVPFWTLSLKAISVNVARTMFMTKRRFLMESSNENLMENFNSKCTINIHALWLSLFRTMESVKTRILSKRWYIMNTSLRSEDVSLFLWLIKVWKIPLIKWKMHLWKSFTHNGIDRTWVDCIEIASSIILAVLCLKVSETE